MYFSCVLWTRPTRCSVTATACINHWAINPPTIMKGWKPLLKPLSEKSGLPQPRLSLRNLIHTWPYLLTNTTELRDRIRLVPEKRKNVSGPLFGDELGQNAALGNQTGPDCTAIWLNTLYECPLKTLAFLGIQCLNCLYLVRATAGEGGSWKVVCTRLDARR